MAECKPAQWKTRKKGPQEVCPCPKVSVITPISPHGTQSNLAGKRQTNACITFSVRAALPSSLIQNAVKAPYYESPCFMQKTGVSSAACLLPEKLKSIGSKELGYQMPGMLSTHSVTSWTSTGCLQLKHHHSFENKKQNTLLGDSDYADSKKFTRVQPTAPGLSSLIAWALGPKLKNSFPNKQSTRTDLFFCSTNNNPLSTKAEYLVYIIYAG